MTVNQKVTGKATSIPMGLLLGAVLSLMVTLAITALLAFMINAELLDISNIGYGVMVMLLTASFTGAMEAYRRIKRQRMVVCLLSGTAYLVMLLSITALFFGGQCEAVGVTATLVLAGSLTAGLLGLGQGRGVKRKKTRIINR